MWFEIRGIGYRTPKTMTPPVIPMDGLKPRLCHPVGELSGSQQNEDSVLHASRHPYADLLGAFENHSELIRHSHKFG